MLSNIQDSSSNRPKYKRLLSLDALRGFSMFLIIGGAEIIIKLNEVVNWWWLDKIEHQFYHARWNGLKFYDIIFPLFLFASGIAISFSVKSMLEKHQAHRSIYSKAFRRMVILVILGIIYDNHPLVFDWDKMRYGSVLGRIGITGFLTTAIIINVRNIKSQLIWMFGLLISYWVLIMFVPVPGYGSGNLTIEGNLTGYIDRLILPGILHDNIYDENGILTQIPATAIVLMGSIIGEVLKLQRTNIKIEKILLISGFVCIVSGILWSFNFPINKHLWSSSFMLVTGGINIIIFSLFYLLIDVLEYKGWSTFFVVIGVNSILAYLLPRLIDIGFTVDYLLNGFYSLGKAPFQNFIREIGIFVLLWLFLYFLYKNKLFIKV